MATRNLSAAPGSARVRIDHSRTKLENQDLDEELGGSLDKLSRLRLKSLALHEGMISKVKTESSSEAIALQMAKLGLTDATQDSPRIVQGTPFPDAPFTRLRARSAYSASLEPPTQLPRARTARPAHRSDENDDVHSETPRFAAFGRSNSPRRRQRRRLDSLAEPSVPHLHLTAARLRVARLRNERQQREIKIKYLRNNSSLCDLVFGNREVTEEHEMQVRRNITQLLKARERLAESVFQGKVREFCRVPRHVETPAYYY